MLSVCTYFAPSFKKRDFRILHLLFVCTQFAPRLALLAVFSVTKAPWARSPISVGSMGVVRGAGGAVSGGRHEAGREVGSMYKPEEEQTRLETAGRTRGPRKAMVPRARHLAHTKIPKLRNSLEIMSRC